MSHNTVLHEIDILIVEDDELLNTVMSLQLQIAGFSVRSARSGALALKMIEDCVPTVLVLDIGLPDMTGGELIAELRRTPSTCSLPLIVHTSLDLSEREKTQLQLGPSKFVTKTTAFSERLAELITELAECKSK